MDDFLGLPCLVRPLHEQTPSGSKNYSGLFGNPLPRKRGLFDQSTPSYGGSGRKLRYYSPVSESPPPPKPQRGLQTSLAQKRMRQSWRMGIVRPMHRLRLRLNFGLFEQHRLRLRLKWYLGRSFGRCFKFSIMLEINNIWLCICFTFPFH